MDIKPVKIAFVGCLHGQLSDIYSELLYKEKSENIKIDLVICCGDFQSVRTEQDLQYMSVPDKYLEMGQFYLYYSGQKKAPFLTIFIGGNHEASNVLDEYHYGGFICENIFYLGRAGVVNYKGVRIGGISGIFKEQDYFKVYHNREFEVAKLSQLTGKVDVMVSHDWPAMIVKPTDINQVCKIKPHFRKDLESNQLGSPATQFLLEHLKPRHWVCAHMHYCYQTMVKHDDNTYTQFTALDKIKKRRTYMIVVDIFVNDVSAQNDNNLYFDQEWLAITKLFNDYTVFKYLNYNFTSFIRNVEFYSKFIKRSGESEHLMVKYNDFDSKLEEYKKFFADKFANNKEDSAWKLVGPKEHRDYVIGILEMFDSFKNKYINRQGAIVNKDEIDVDIDI